MATIFFLIIIIFSTVFRVSNSTEFIFNEFPIDESNLTLQESSIVKPSGVLKLTNTSKNAMGHAFFANPVQMFSQSNSSSVSSFSTYFVFAIVTPAKRFGGFGLAFTISPAKEFPYAEPGQFLGIFNSANDGSHLNRVLAVDFDTVNGFGTDTESNGNHVGININSLNSTASKPAQYYIDQHNTGDMDLDSGDPIQAWVEYNGTTKNITVTIAPTSVQKPAEPLCFFVSDLSTVFEQNMYVGFSASTGKNASFHYILAWSFKTNGDAPLLNISNLPEVPKEKTQPSLRPRIKAFIATLSCVVILLAMWVMYAVYKKKRQHEILEEWELDCPHRFTYIELFKATKGFKPSEMIGAGGSAEVYKGTLPSSRSEIAVKKIARNSIQGLREFVSEVESLGRLRHKNLVNLQGWCKKKDDLLLVYDYIPNGSLDTLLYKPKNNFVLNWEQRKNILKGIASGLLYLHEEWVKVVIHRDVKSSNVLIDNELNGRLGDFGLARLHSHEQVSYTTNVVGTIGYIAPELARTGKASTSSDVFAYGVLLLEVACGCRPINADSTPGYLILVDWVMECQQMGKILQVVDSKLGENYDVEEMELVLKLGLVCAHPRQSSRPTMRQVLRYLNGEDKLCEIEDWRSSTDSFDKLTSRFLEVISNDSFTKSIPNSSLSGISLNSVTKSIPSPTVAHTSSNSLGGR